MVTVVTVVTLAAGLGASAAMFSVVDALILRSFPIDGIDRLVMVAVTSPGASFEDESVAPADFLDWRAQSKTVDRLVAFEYWDANLVGRDEPERVQGFFVSPGFFEILGRSPALGRSFLDEEETIGHHRQVVLGHGLWLRRFAGDRAIIGQAVLLDGEPYTVIGIAPESFDFPSGAELWAPLAFPPEVARRRDVQYLTVVGQLDEGRTIEDARAELRAIGDRLRQQHPATNGSRGVEVRRLDEGLRDEGSIEFLTVLQASALLVLLIGCANVANLLMAVGAARQRELAVRVALGASRPRLVRQLLLESGVLGVTAAAASLPLTWLGVELIRTSMPANIARFILGWQTIDVDGRVVLFTLALAVTTSMLFGTWPALQASNPQLAGTLKEGGRGTQGGVRHRVRRALVVGEIALALMLLVAAALNISGSIRTTC
jgi:putative ABC transport system permease protein